MSAGLCRYEDTYVDAWLYSDHQRYFFFQQLSTVGALLQLVVHGPGQYSMDESDGPVQVRPPRPPRRPATPPPRPPLARRQIRAKRRAHSSRRLCR